MLFNKKIKKLEEEKDELFTKYARSYSFAVSEFYSHERTLRLILDYFENIKAWSDEDVQFLKIGFEVMFENVKTKQKELDEMINH